MMESVVDALSAAFELHRGSEITDTAANGAGERIRGIANGNGGIVDKDLIERLPKLEIIANFGVGYDSTLQRRPRETSSSPIRRMC
jgi:lactate dehydrogenase-like 2-hydroxyacid dehydrogenase